MLTCDKGFLKTHSSFTEDESEREGSGPEELAMQDLSSFFPLKKEHTSVLRRSCETDNCRDGGSCRWTLSRTTSAPCMRARVSSDHNHLLLRRLLFGLRSPGNNTFVSFSRGLSDRLGNELLGIALVPDCFTERIDLTLVVVVDSVDRRLQGNRLDSRLVGVAGY